MMQFIGFMSIMVLAASAASFVQSTSSDPAFISWLAQYSKLAATHATAICWAAFGIICLAGTILPPILLQRDAEDGKDSIGAIGTFVSSTLLGYVLLFVALPSVAYLFGMGWFAARKAAGF